MSEILIPSPDETLSKNILPHLDTSPQQESEKNSEISTLVFGVGPIIDKKTRIQAAEAQKKEEEEHGDQARQIEDGILHWSENLARAGAILYQDKIVKHFVVMGGQTGGEKYRSEAELITKDMADLDVPLDAIEQEKRSLDTVENIVYALELAKKNGRDIQEADILCAGRHGLRAALMLKFFGVHVRHRFAAEEVIRHKARLRVDELNGIPAEELDETSAEDYRKHTEVLNRLEGMLDANNRNTFYEKQLGAERRDYQDNMIYNGVWLRETLTYPARILAPAAKVTDDNRLRKIIQIALEVYGDNKNPTPEPTEGMSPEDRRKLEIEARKNITNYGFDLEKDSPSVLREKMQKFEWPFLTKDEKQADVDLWLAESKVRDGYPPEILGRLQRLQDYQLN